MSIDRDFEYQTSLNNISLLVYAEDDGSRTVFVEPEQGVLMKEAVEGVLNQVVCDHTNFVRTGEAGASAKRIAGSGDYESFGLYGLTERAADLTVRLVHELQEMNPVCDLEVEEVFWDANAPKAPHGE